MRIFDPVNRKLYSGTKDDFKGKIYTIVKKGGIIIPDHFTLEQINSIR